MQVVYQDCGCIAIPDEIVEALGLNTGSVLDITYSKTSRSVIITAATGDLRTAKAVANMACRILTPAE